MQSTAARDDAESRILRLLEPVSLETYAKAGLRAKADADSAAMSWLDDLVEDGPDLGWSWHGPESVRAEPVPQLPCVVFTGSREFHGWWVPTLFLMAGRRDSCRYFQWASCGLGPPSIGRDAVVRLNRLVRSLAMTVGFDGPES